MQMPRILGTFDASDVSANISCTVQWSASNFLCVWCMRVTTPLSTSSSHHHSRFAIIIITGRGKKPTTTEYEKGELFVALGLVGRDCKSKAVWEQRKKGNQTNRRTKTTIELLCVCTNKRILIRVTNATSAAVATTITTISCKHFCWITQFITSIFLSSDLRWHHPMMLDSIAGRRKSYHRSFVSILYLSRAHYCHWWQLDSIYDDSIPSEISISSTSHQDSSSRHLRLRPKRKHQCQLIAKWFTICRGFIRDGCWHWLKMRNKWISTVNVRLCFASNFLEWFRSSKNTDRAPPIQRVTFCVRSDEKQRNFHGFDGQ